jgi:hypothetical protein
MYANMLVPKLSVLPGSDGDFDGDSLRLFTLSQLWIYLIKESILVSVMLNRVFQRSDFHP